ncbi:MAG: hypothetical protein K6G88_05210 [Lachnospiraceae bacterium]|nr:hypothetical protein [Lachnospiraceae bacterium]
MIIKYTLITSIGIVAVLMITLLIKNYINSKKAGGMTFAGKNKIGENYIFLFIAGMIFQELNIIRIEYKMPDSTFGSSKEAMLIIVLLNIFSALFIVFNIFRKNVFTVYEKENIRCGKNLIPYEKIDAVSAKKISDKKNLSLIDLDIFINNKVYYSQNLTTKQFEEFKRKISSKMSDNIFDNEGKNKKPGIGIMYIMIVWIFVATSLVLSAARELIIVSFLGIILPGLFMCIYAVIFMAVMKKSETDRMQDKMSKY